MAVPGMAKIDYSNRDFSTIKTSMINFIKTKFPKDYTDFSEGKLGMMLMELYAWVGDMLSYMIDTTANEAYISTCKQIANAFKLAYLLGYHPRNPTAASVTMKVNTQLPSGYPLDCTIPTKTQIVTNGIYFETLNNFIIPASTPEMINGPTFFEGRSVSDTFTADGTIFQSYTLTEKSIISNSIIVEVNSVVWDYYESLIFIGDNNGYTILFTSDYGAIIRFGDGVSGRIPASLDTIVVSYRVGGGTKGNIAALSVSKSIAATLSDMTPVQVYITNENVGSGGEDAEDIEGIRLNAPLYYRTHRNLITQEDYNTLISTFSDPTYGRIAKGIAVPRYGQTNSSANEIDIYVLARGPSNIYVSCSTGLKEALLNYLNERAVLVVDTFIWDGVIKSININCSAVIDLGYNTADNMRSAIQGKIELFFTRNDINLGDTFYVSQLYEWIMSIPGVIQVNLGIPGSYKYPDLNKTVLLATVVGLSTKIYVTVGGMIIDAYVGGTILFTSGLQNTRQYRIIRNGTDYITVGSIISNLVPGDTAEIHSELNLITDIPLAQNEIYQLGTLNIDLYYYAKDTREVVLIP